MEKLDNYLINKYNVNVLNLKKKYFLSEKHIHGLDPLHYESGYYNNFIINLFNHFFKKDTTSIYELQNFSMNDLKFKNFIEKVPAKSNLLALENIWQEKRNFNILNDGSIEILVENIDKKIYNQLHSLPIEINSSKDSPLCFKLTFDIWIENIHHLSNDDDSIFLIRTYSDKFQVWHKNALHSYTLRAKDYGVISNTWKNIEIIFYPVGRFLRVGPYLAQNGFIKWKNLKLELV